MGMHSVLGTIYELLSFIEINAWNQLSFEGKNFVEYFYENLTFQTLWILR